MVAAPLPPPPATRGRKRPKLGAALEGGGQGPGWVWTWSAAALPCPACRLGGAELSCSQATAPKPVGCSHGAGCYCQQVAPTSKRGLAGCWSQALHCGRPAASQLVGSQQGEGKLGRGSQRKEPGVGGWLAGWLGCGLAAQYSKGWETTAACLAARRGHTIACAGATDRTRSKRGSRPPCLSWL